ncbi:MAG: mechanosensitive ion channel [Acidobacteria bacterium]|nr:mechanosensitive ion channel [Acidobacteriota bacterium]
MYTSRTAAYYQDQLVLWGPKVLVAIVIIIVTWIVAKLVKGVLQKTVDRVPALQRQSGQKPGQTVGHQLGTIAKLIIWLVGIMAALQILGIGQILQPINALTNQIFSFLPRLIGAGLIFFIGLIVARIVRELVETLIGAAPLESVLAKVGVSEEPSTTDSSAAEGGSGTARATIAKAAGIIVFALIIIPVAIAALQVLGIEAISGPAINMLNQIMAAIPRVLSAALWLGIAFLAAGLVKTFIQGVLPATGFDSAVKSTGMVPATTSPSSVVANIVFVIIMLGAGIEAARQLGGTTIAQFLAEVTALGTKVIFGTVIILAGVFLARMVAGLMGSSQTDGGFAQTMVRYAIIALFTAIGLRFMGLANEIVILAFGLILGSAALATGLAFGLGGRKPAERVLDQYASDALEAKPIPPPTAKSGQPS